jgi:hypothetical protein
MCYEFTAELSYLSPLLKLGFKAYLSGISELRFLNHKYALGNVTCCCN